MGLQADMTISKMSHCGHRPKAVANPARVSFMSFSGRHELGLSFQE